MQAIDTNVVFEQICNNKANAQNMLRFYHLRLADGGCRIALIVLPS